MALLGRRLVTSHLLMSTDRSVSKITLLCGSFDLCTLKGELKRSDKSDKTDVS